MAANTSPIFTKNGSISSVLVTAANTSSQGGGTIATDIFKAFTADATNGSLVARARWIPTASSASTATNGTVGRLFISSVTSGSTTSSNTYLWEEIALPVVTADATANSVFAYDIILGFWLPPSYTILVTNHAAPASNTAWRCTVIAGDG